VFLDIFKKKFKKRHEETKMAKKYDLLVYEVDANGQEKAHPENGIMGNSPAEIIGIYKMCGQKVQIVREYSDEESQNYGKKRHLNEKDVTMDNGAPGLMRISDEQQKQIDAYTNQKPVSQPVQQTPPQNMHNSPQQTEPVKYLTVGGIKCKIENGKFYQKQWITLSEDEASEIRIISNKNNKICSLKDKHIEIMKWIRVEENDTENKQPEMELING
jgi:hypothetical protein